MPQVLTTGAQVGCGPAPAHGGLALLTSSSKLTVSGTPVLCQSGIGAIAGCAQTTSPATPDLKVLSLSSGFSQKLASDGTPVLLSTLAGLGSGSPSGAITATETQTKLVAS